MTSSASSSWYEKVKNGKKFLEFFEDDDFLCSAREEFDDSGAIDVAKALREPSNHTTGLRVRASHKLTHVGLTALAKTIAVHNHLAHFCLRDFGPGADDKAATAIAEMLRANPILSHLDLGGCSWWDDRIAHIIGALEENTNLQFLSLEHTGVGVDGSNYGRCDASGLALAKVLKVNNALGTLNIGQAEISNTVAAALRESLQLNSTLRTLNISDLTIEEAGWVDLTRGLGQNQSVENLILNKFDPCFDSDDTCTDDSDSTGEEDEEYARIRILADMLTVNESIQSLSLASSRLYDDAAFILSRGLAANKTLQSLDLSCASYASHLGSAGAQSIARALATSNSPLQILNLKNNPVGTTGVRALIEPLRNSALKSLVLSGLFFDMVVTTVAAETLAEMLRSCSQLQSLTIDDNSFSDDDIGVLVEEGLAAENCRLQELSLNENSFGDEGLIALSGALTTNTTLRTLAVIDMDFGKKGVKAVAEALRVNKTLQTLRMCTLRNERNVQRLVRALKCNDSLLSFYSLPYLSPYPWQSHCDRNIVLYLVRALGERRLPLSALPLICDQLQHKVLLGAAETLVRCILYRLLRNVSSPLWMELRRRLVGTESSSSHRGGPRQDRKRKAAACP